ncbi:MAG: NADH:flavin oxidoreductase/NADH oxidase [Proteobacteria bacterium]|nr:NADH:flavin oxidoreductase/NADH oxidase [Pseudomonadota bacterium]
MSMPKLFTPLELRSVTLPNRVVLSPLCMYAAKDGLANAFHFSHLTAFARGRVGLVFSEATAVVPEGRISHGCCGLWNDAQVEAYRPIVAAIAEMGAVPAIQIAHAGRKASARPPWAGGLPLDASDAAKGSPPWQVSGPSSEPVNTGWPAPHAMTEAEIAAMVESFAAAARRSAKAGFKVLEIHAAHGYLIHSFLSPISNRRNDRYGGERAGRMRFCLEVVEAVRAAWPAELPLFVRISAVDGPPKGWDVEDSVALARELKGLGVDVVDCSAGGISGPPAFRANDTGQPLKSGGERAPGFQVPYAERVKRDAGIATMAVGVITTGPQAEAILQDGRADLIAIGRELMHDPFWPLHAAEVLGCDPDRKMWPQSYGWAIQRRAQIQAENRAR